MPGKVEIGQGDEGEMRGDEGKGKGEVSEG